MELELITTIFASAGTSGALVWLSKSWISQRIKSSITHEYSRKLEEHKIALKADYEPSLLEIKAEQDKHLEHLKAELLIQSAKSSVRFEKTYDRMAEYLEGIYVRVSKIAKLLNHYSIVLTLINKVDINNLQEEIPALIADLDEYVEPRELYIPKEISVKVRRISTKFKRIECAMTRSIEIGSLEPLNEVSENVTKYLVELEDDIIQSARALLGVETRREWQIQSGFPVM
jgi:hypothetical protein